MIAGSLSRRFRPSSTDLLLVVLAAVGFTCYALFLPENHPDSTAKYALQTNEIIDRANSFLATQGYPTAELDIEARLTRNVELLRDMQEDLGRTRTVEILGSGDASTLPAYFWSVSYRLHDSEGRTTVFTVKLTQTGTPWAFLNNLSDVNATRTRLRNASRLINKNVLGRVFTPHDSLLAETVIRIQTVSDSLILENLRFAQPGGAENRALVFGDSATRALEHLESGNRALLDSTSVVALGKYFAPAFLLRGGTWIVEFLRVLGSGSGQIAELRFQSHDPVDSQVIRVDLTVSSRGTLQEMDLVFNPEKNQS
ncbi:MAG: hypothetical protein IIA50_01050, partial [Bacteroidetes bacterium]|nr:hypothetical protein [Bacteroidota bacterium]